MTEKLLRLPAVIERVGLGKSEIYKRMADGTFPKSIALSRKIAVWPESQVKAWIDEVVANAR